MSVKNVLALLCFYTPVLSFASGINYQGRIIDPNGRAVEAAGVTFAVQITSPTSECVLYSENFNLDMRGTNGFFSFVIGNGPRTDGGSRPLAELMAPNLVLTATPSCPEGYSRGAGEGLLLHMSFNDGIGGEQNLSPLQINPSPMSFDTIKVAGADSQNVLRLSDGPATPMTIANFNEMLALINGTSTQYLKTGGGAISESDLPVITTAGKVVGSAITSGTIGGATAISTTGSIATSGLVSSNLMSTRTLGIANPSDVTISVEAPASLASPYTLKLPGNAGVGGQVLSTDGSGNLSWIATGGTGTVSQIATGTGLTGGPITTTGTITLADTSVTPGVYGSSTAIPTFTVDAQGRLTAAANTALSTYQGTTSGTFAAGDDARITGALQSNGGTMTGALTLATGTTNLSPLRLPAGTLVTTAVSGNIESDGTHLYYTNNAPLRQKLAGYTGTPTNGQLLIGNGTGFSLANLTAGSGITITDSPGGISIAATASSGNYALLDGRAGGQTLKGGTAATENLTLDSTNHATKGNIILAPTGGQVGIGTSSPATKLEVADNTWSAVLATTYSATTGSNIEARRARGTAAAPTAAQSGDELGSFGARGYGASAFGSGETGKIGFYAGENFTNTAQGTYLTVNTTPTGSATSTERLRITSTGNVGIGTTAPESALQIASSSNAQAGLGSPANYSLYLSAPVNTNSEATGIGFGRSTNSNIGAAILHQRTGAGSQGELQFYTKSSTIDGAAPALRMVIDNAGSVGIGTSIPASELNVVSTRTSDPRGITLSQYTTDALGAHFIMRKSRGTASSPVAIVNGDELGAIVPGGYDGTSFTMPGLAGFITNGAIATGSIPTDFRINTGSTGYGTERLRITSAGNVGIGTSTPGSLLDIGLAGTTLGTMRLEGNTSGYVQIQPAAAAGSWTMTLPANAGTNGYALTTNGSGVTSWTSIAGGNPALSSITAATAANTLANANFAQIWNWDTLTTGTGMTMAAGGTSITSGSVLTLTNSRNNAASNGSVLNINTTGDSNAAVPLVITNAGTGLSMRVNDDGTTTDATPFVIDDAGNVGIGTASPGEKITMAYDSPTLDAINIKNTNVAGPSSIGFTDAGGIYRGKIGFDNSTGNFFMASGAMDIVFQTSTVSGSSEAMRIDSATSNVGIGTTSPSFLLSLTGTGADQTIGMERETTAATAGRALTIQAGGATSGSTDKAGGDLVLSSGISTGNGGSDIGFYTAAGGQGTGTTSRNPINKIAQFSGIHRSIALIGGPANGLYSTAIGYGMQVDGDNSLGVSLDTNLHMVSQSNAMVIMGGSVGIGTTAPGALLHVENAAGNAEARVRSTQNDADATLGLYAKPILFGSMFGQISFNDSGSADFNMANVKAIRTDDSAGGGEESDLIFETVFNAGTNYPSERMRIRYDGNVGIGNTAPSQLLHVGSASVAGGTAVANFQNANGTCTITPASSGSGIACSSDERLKENFEEVSGGFALNQILKLQAVTYNFKTSSPESRHTGYKAQEVQKIAPDFVRVNDDGYLQVYYDAFIPWITESIKTIYQRVIGVENQQQTLRRAISSLDDQKVDKTEVGKLKAENADLKSQLVNLKSDNQEIHRKNQELENRLQSQEKELILIKRKLGL